MKRPPCSPRALLCPFHPLGTAGLCHWLGRSGSGRCQRGQSRPSRLDQGEEEGEEEEEEEEALPEPRAARATSGDVITGTNSHLAQRCFQLPAGLPRHLQELPWPQSSPATDPSGLPWPCNNPATPQGPLALQQPAVLAPAGQGRLQSSSRALTQLLGEVWELWVGSRCLLSLLSPGSLQPCGAAVGPSQPGTMNVFDRSINFDALFKFSHM